jgi:Protein of unknown function (DUF3300)
LVAPLWPQSLRWRRARSRLPGRHPPRRRRGVQQRSRPKVPTRCIRKCLRSCRPPVSADARANGLYPDDLLADVLAAATYPLDVVEAARWLQDPQNAAVRGDQLFAALQPKSWDPSVKSLALFPRILRMLDANIDWTEQLG